MSAHSSVSSRAVFFDKDGTLIENVPYNVDCSQIRVMPGAVEAVKLLRAAGYKIVVITNQSGVAQGYFNMNDVRCVEDHLCHLLSSCGAPLDGFYFCPHHPEGTVAAYAITCNCRKPQEGMLRKAAQQLELDLARSWMIGDILDDVEAGHRAGCRSILLNSGGETEWIESPLRKPEFIATDPISAAHHILNLEDFAAHQESCHEELQPCLTSQPPSSTALRT
jgi:histidinol-phosphate phosphatase family protein